MRRDFWVVRHPAQEHNFRWGRLSFETQSFPGQGRHVRGLSGSLFANMGNTTSVSPSEDDDDVSTSSGPHPNDRKIHQTRTRSKAPTPEEESENESDLEGPVGAAEASERIDRVLEEVLDDRIASGTPPNAREVDTPSANSGSDKTHNRQQSDKGQVPINKDPSKNSLEGRTEEEREEGSAVGKEPELQRLLEDAGSGSGSSSSGFYTNSSYSGSENLSEVYASEDDSFSVRDVRAQLSALSPRRNVHIVTEMDKRIFSRRALFLSESSSNMLV